MTTALIAGFLMAGAVYLILQREMLRVVLGFILLSQAANMILIAAGGTSRREQPFGAPAYAQCQNHGAYSHREQLLAPQERPKIHICAQKYPC